MAEYRKNKNGPGRAFYRKDGDNILRIIIREKRIDVTSGDNDMFLIDELLYATGESTEEEFNSAKAEALAVIQLGKIV